MVKRGKYAGLQRWFCKDCGTCHTVSHKRQNGAQINELYRTGRHSAADIASRLGVSERTVFRKIDVEADDFYLGGTTALGPDVVVMMDTTYWGRAFGVVILKDNISGRVLWAKFIGGKEHVSDYEEGIRYVESQGVRILGLVCDGLKGLRASFKQYPFQLCQFHIAQHVRTKLTSRPKTAAGQELLGIANLLCHTDKESFVGLLDEWEGRWGSYVREKSVTESGKKYYTHQRLWSAFRSLRRNTDALWTFYDNPGARLPNTNNAMEGLNSSIKDKLNRHKGISTERRKALIIQLLKAHKPKRNS